MRTFQFGSLALLASFVEFGIEFSSLAAALSFDRRLALIAAVRNHFVVNGVVGKMAFLARCIIFVISSSELAIW